MVGDLSRFKGFWTEERCVELVNYWHAGLTDVEIGILLGRTPRAIGQRRILLNLRRDSFWDRKEEVTHELAPVWFPQFENITKQEAAKARDGCPPSAPIRIPAQTSVVGNSTAMVMGINR